MKDVITILSSVYSPDSVEGHNYFVARLDPIDLKRIKRLAEIVGIEKIDHIAVGNFPFGDVYEGPPIDPADPVDPGEAVLVCPGYQGDFNLNGQADADENPERRCEGPILVVSDTEIRWDWTPRHGDNTDTCSSEVIAIKDLEAAFE